MNSHERALKTYNELQKRKIKKAKKLNLDLYFFRQDSFYKCLSRRRDLVIYR